MMSSGAILEQQRESPRVHPKRSTFGKYVLLRKLASGGMGEIFLARERGPAGLADDLLVIKRILSHHLDKKDYLDMFFSEARLVARLNHQNIIQIYEMGEIEGDHYIAMEYVRGKSLRDVIDRLRAAGQSMPIAHVVDLGIKLCEGLGYAHQARDARGRPMNIVHRDINPHNILISYQSDLKLIDFGIAKSEMTSVHTATGTIKGKFVYMSPEQSAADPLDKRSDIFSVGIVLYEMLALENPFLRQNVVLSLEAIQRHPVPPPSKRRADAAALDQVLLRALHKAPEDRFQSAIEMRDGLRKLVRSGKVPPPPTDLNRFLQQVFRGDIAEEDRLLDEADEAARSLVNPRPVLVTAGAEEPTDSGERSSPGLAYLPPPAASSSLLNEGTTIAGSPAFTDEEPTVTGHPDDMAISSLDVGGVAPALRPLPRSRSAAQPPPPPPRGPSADRSRSRVRAAPTTDASGADTQLAASPMHTGSASAAAATYDDRYPSVVLRPGPGPAFVRGLVYVAVFVATTAAGFLVTRSFLERRTNAAVVTDAGPGGRGAAPSAQPAAALRPQGPGLDAGAPSSPARPRIQASQRPATNASAKRPSPELKAVSASSSSRTTNLSAHSGRARSPATSTSRDKPKVAAPGARSPRASRPRRKKTAEKPSKKRVGTSETRARPRAPSEARATRPTPALPNRTSPPMQASAPKRRLTPIVPGAAAPPPIADAKASKAAPVKGRMHVTVSAPVAVVANGRRLGDSPSAFNVRKPTGKLVLSGGRDVDYAITLKYAVEAEGITVRIETSPWAIVKHDGLSLGRTPRGPIRAAPSHRFSLLRPGQSVPLVVALKWHPEE